MAAALSLLSQAANGTTYEEFRKCLHLNREKTIVADQFHEIFGLIDKSAGQSELMITNQIYLQQSYQLNEHFQEIAVYKFHSGVEIVNFGEANQTAQLINNFVAVKTKGKIQGFVKPKIFDINTRAFLVNAIYLKSVWLEPFPRRSSKRVYNESFYKEKFYISESETVDIEFMSMKKNVWHAIVNELDVAALRLDYANSNFSFIIILPNTRTGLSSLEAQMHNVNLSTIIDQMSFSKCHIKIPKFKVESAFEMNDILKKVYDHQRKYCILPNPISNQILWFCLRWA